MSEGEFLWNLQYSTGMKDIKYLARDF